MANTLTQRHIDLLNSIARAPSPIDTSQIFTALRRPSFEDLRATPTPTNNAPHQRPMSGIYIRSRPTSFSEFDVMLDPNVDYADILARPPSPIGFKQTMDSLGLRLEKGNSLIVKMNQLKKIYERGEGGLTSSAAVVVPSAVRPSKPTRPVPEPKEPPASCERVAAPVTDHEGDDDEIVYMLKDGKTFNQCMLADAVASARASSVLLPDTTQSSISLTDHRAGPENGIQFLNGCSAATANSKDTQTDSGRDKTLPALPIEQHAEEETAGDGQGWERKTSRANKRMGMVRIQLGPNGHEAPSPSTSPVEEAWPAIVSPEPRPPTSSMSVAFAPGPVIQRKPKTSQSTTGSSAGTAVSRNSSEEETKVGSNEDEPSKIVVEVMMVDFDEIEKAGVKADEEARKKRTFGVYKVFRNVLRRGGSESNIEKPPQGPAKDPTVTPAATVAVEQIESKGSTPSIATTRTKPNVLRKPAPSPSLRTKASKASMATAVAADNASQKSRKPFPAWSIRSGRGGKNGANDPAQNCATGGTGSGPLAPGPSRGVFGPRQRSASFSGFATMSATMSAPVVEDDAEMDKLLEEALERVRQNPDRDWVYKPKSRPVLEQGENPIDVGFVLERHVAA